MYADIILNSVGEKRNIITMESGNPFEEALAIKDGKIIAIGLNRDLECLKGSKTKVIDLDDNIAMPGFIDAHAHFITYGTNMLGINLKSEDVKSIGDIKNKVRERAESSPPGKWIRGWGYDHTKLIEKRHPDRFDLDEVAKNYPVILTRTCGHIAVVNSKALELAGLKDDASDPPGGKFGRYDGKLNGVLYESAQRKVTAAAAFTLEEYKSAIKQANYGFLSKGITSVSDAGMGGRLGIQGLIESFVERKIQVRVNLFASNILGDNIGDYFLETGLTTGFGNNFISLGPYKVMVDGSSSGPTCATRKAYTSDINNTGILYYTQDELDRLIEKAHIRGFQLSAHCVGDKAIEMMLNAIEKAFKKHPKKHFKGLRPRIEHCAICPADLVERIKRLGVIPVVQPIFFHEFGDGYIENYGRERTNYMFPLKSFINNNILAAMSTDAPVSMLDPLKNIYEAVTRKTLSGKSCGQAECITVYDALRAYTYNSAYASFQEDIKGSLKVGKLGDVVVLSKNILEVPIDNISDIKVEMTISNGEIVYINES
ncbi:MAG: amidohydrolase [Deferribacterota bacterium]|nr:amidohydrolase [Deferribacterota bacterium]